MPKGYSGFLSVFLEVRVDNLTAAVKEYSWRAIYVMKRDFHCMDGYHMKDSS